MTSGYNKLRTSFALARTAPLDLTLNPRYRTAMAAEQIIPGRKRGLAPTIRKIAVQYPELTHSEIARTVGCDPSNVTCVLKTFLGNTSPEQLADFQQNKADIYDAMQHRLLASLTDDKINKSKVMEAVTAAAILEDKARLVRGQATGINVSVLLDVAESIRAMRDQPKPAQVVDSERSAHT